MRKTEPYRLNAPMFYPLKKGTMKRIIIVLLIIPLIILGYQVLKTYIVTVNTESLSENFNIYYYGESKPPIILKLIYNDRIIHTQDIFTEDTSNGDLIIIYEDIIKVNYKNNEVFMSKMRNKIADGTTLVIYSRDMSPSRFTSDLGIKTNAATAAQPLLYNPLYLYMDNQILLYEKYELNTTLIKSLNEANLIQEILEISH